MNGLVVVNPASGASRGIELWREGLDVCSHILGTSFKKGTGPYCWTVLETNIDGSWIEALNHELAKGLDALVCVGGDGTIASVARACLKFPKTSVLLVPGGRGNDAVRGLYGYEGSVAKFWKWAQLQSWSCRPTDLAEINGQAFFNMASLGYGGHVVEVSQDRNAIWSRTPAVYMIEGALGFFSWKEIRAKVMAGDRKIYDGLCFGAFVGNGKSNGHGLQWTKNARFDDGKIDLILFEKPTPLQFAVGISHVRKGGTLPFSSVYASEPALDIDFEVPTPLEIDGDYAGCAAHYSVRSLPQSVRIWVPKS